MSHPWGDDKEFFHWSLFLVLSNRAMTWVWAGSVCVVRHFLSASLPHHFRGYASLLRRHRATSCNHQVATPEPLESCNTGGSTCETGAAPLEPGPPQGSPLTGCRSSWPNRGPCPPPRRRVRSRSFRRPHSMSSALSRSQIRCQRRVSMRFEHQCLVCYTELFCFFQEHGGRAMVLAHLCDHLSCPFTTEPSVAQLQALRYVSFNVATITKCAKGMPVILWVGPSPIPWWL